MSILKTIYLQHLNGSSPNATLDANGNMTVTGTVVSSSPTGGMRNKIINGDMRIDQRYAGTANTLQLTASSSTLFVLDRWNTNFQKSGKLTIQRNSAAVTPPVGFNFYHGANSTSSYTMTTNDFFDTFQPIEGYNTADLAWGTSSAKPVTLSFWAYSSLTGTFSGYLLNGAGNRCLNFTYPINSANTWEYKTLTFSGDTSGTWNTDNTVGLYVVLISYGAHSSTYASSTNTWNNGLYRGVTGQTNIVSTSGATFYFTGVQLEVGTIATPFERRPFGLEFQLCQRYYHKTTPYGTIPNPASASGGFWTMIETGETTRVLAPFNWPVPMRTNPTVTAYSITTGNSGVWRNRTTGADVTVSSIGTTSDRMVFNTLSSAQTAGNQIIIAYSADAEL